MKIILHAGFHKTGTSSLQKTLRVNRRALAPDIRIILRPGMKALCEAARGWSATQDVLDLGLVKYEAALLGEAIGKVPAPIIIMSSEDLAGHMPGRKGVKTYGAAPRLMQSIALGLRTAMPDAELQFFFTTRQKETWLASCYAQHLSASRMRLSTKDYVRKFAKSAALDAQVDAIAAAMPDHKVTRAALEDCADRPLGPADALLDVVGFDEKKREKLRASPLEKVAPDAELRAALLALNQSTLGDDELRAAKHTLLKRDI